MDIFLLLSGSLLTVFYLSYFIKQLLLKKRGIATNRLARGNKPKRNFWIELLLLISTYSMAVIQYLTIFWQPDNRAPLLIFRLIGVSLLFFGVYFFIAAITVMRDSWRAGIDPLQKTKMITDGIYKFSRNPAFVGFDLLYLGFTLIYPNLFTVFGTIITIILLHLQILEEEKYLITEFGEEYIAYKRKTTRYLFF